MINAEYFWLNIVFLALGAISVRGSIIALSAKINISQKWREIFSFIPAAVFPAFIAPAVFFHQGKVAWVAGHERVIILVFATGVSYLTKNTLATIAFGLISLYLLGQI
jgi:branched-subunit amino acid transport protein